MQEQTARNIAKMCAGQPSQDFDGEGRIDQVIIDSRKLSTGCLFVAIKGSNGDGHDFVAEVVSKAGNFALVSQDYPLCLPNLIRVPDPSAALGQLAANYRQLFRLPLVAITGSNGKTTVKEMLKQVCREQYGSAAVLATNGNLNNHLGMPLTLLELNPEHRVAIIEMGMNHSGELNYLSKLARPTLACVNNVMFAHAGHFKSLDEIATAKGEVFNGLDKNGLACINLTNPYSPAWQARLRAAGIPQFEYGTVNSACYLKSLSADGGACYVTPLGEVCIKLALLGEHNYQNALSVISLAVNLDCDLSAIKKGLESYQGYTKRLERKQAFNGALIIDDTYNANPDSVKAALQAIQGLPGPYWFIFADLKELGASELAFHQQIGEALAGFAICKLLTIGDLAAHAAKFYKGAKIHFASNQDIVKYCQLNLPAEATLLIKGSNSMNLEQVAHQLTLEPINRGKDI